MRRGVDSHLTDAENERLRARLARAGLLAHVPGSMTGRPALARLREAQGRAGHGKRLAELVDEGRG